MLLIHYGVLKDKSKLQKYRSGASVYESVDESALHIVLKGEVGLFSANRDGSRDLLATVGPGGFFGEAALAEGKRPPHAAMALTDVIALPVGLAGAAEFMQEEPELAFELIKALCERVCTADATKEKAAGRATRQTVAQEKPVPQVKNAPTDKPAPQAKAAAPQPKAAPQAAAAKPKAASSAPPVAVQPAAGVSLFPEGHGSYSLDLRSGDRTYLMESSFTCPMCKNEFTVLRVRESRLVVERADADMRNHYRGVEPLYYDVVTCPHCLYSALADMFKTPNTLKADLSELNALKPSLPLHTGAEMDAFSVFAGYYLALICAPKCFTAHHTATAKLLLKLSRVYQDCGDTAMEEKTAKQALEAYTFIYLNEDSTPEIDQQLCLVIGELYLKLGDTKNARDYFFKVKTNREGSQVFKTQAENRLAEIKGA